MLYLMLDCSTCDRYIKDYRLSPIRMMRRAKELGWICTDNGDKCPTCVMQEDQAMIDRARPLDGLAACNACQTEESVDMPELLRQLETFLGDPEPADYPVADFIRPSNAIELAARHAVENSEPAEHVVLSGIFDDGTVVNVTDKQLDQIDPGWRPLRKNPELAERAADWNQVP